MLSLVYNYQPTITPIAIKIFIHRQTNLDAVNNQQGVRMIHNGKPQYYSLAHYLSGY